MTARLLAVVLLAVVSIVGFSAAPASAVCAPGLSDGKDAPVPESPTQGFVSVFAGTGGQGSLLQHKATSGAAGKPTTGTASGGVYARTGLAGLTFHTYDLGCGGWAADPPSSLATTLANWSIVLPKMALAIFGYFAAAVYHPESWLGLLDPVLTEMAPALSAAITAPLAPMLALVVALATIVAARRLEISKALTTLVLVGVAATVVGVAVNYPVKAGHLADSAVTESVGAINAQVGQRIGSRETVDPAASVMESMVDAVLYKQWLAGTFGSANSDTAKRYGPRLLAAQALTWDEAARIEKDPKAAKGIVEAKQKDWLAVYETVHDADPVAYEFMVGRQSVDRLAQALVVFIAVILLLPVATVSMVLVVMSYLAWRLLWMGAPVWATLAIVVRSTLRTVGEILVASVANAVIFATGVTVLFAVAGSLLGADNVPGFLALILVGLLSLIMWFVLAPFRHLTKFVKGSDPMRDGINGPGSVVRKGMKFGSRVASSYLGNELADLTDKERAAREDEPGDDSAGARPETYSRPAPTADVDEPPVAPAAPSSPIPVRDIHLVPDPDVTFAGDLPPAVPRPPEPEPAGPAVVAAPAPMALEAAPVAAVAPDEPGQAQYAPATPLSGTVVGEDVAVPAPSEWEVGPDGQQRYTVYKPGEGIVTDDTADAGTAGA